jgi:hypothetical protein
MSVVNGLIGGIVGAIVLAIIMTAMESKVKAAPPAILAEKFMGDASKKPMVMFVRFGIWGIIYGIAVSQGLASGGLSGGATFALLPWLVLNLVMLPMAGAGIGGTKKWNMIPIVTLVLHLIWGAIAGIVFGLI